jgi:hypothetical protein
MLFYLLIVHTISKTGTIIVTAHNKSETLFSMTCLSLLIQKSFGIISRSLLEDLLITGQLSMKTG